MSVEVDVVCVDCHEEAPPVDHGGFFGWPSLGQKPVKDSLGGRMYPFGWLYDGFARLGLIPADVEDMRAFLEAHQGHKLWMIDDLSEPDSRLDYDRVVPFEPPATSAAPLYFAVTTVDQRDRWATDAAEWLMPVPERRLEPADIEFVRKHLFRPRIGPSIAMPSSLAEPESEEFRALGEFLTRHKDQPLIAGTLPL